MGSTRNEQDPAQDVPIDDDMIRLGQFLKLANVIEDGATARLLLTDEVVRVNGQSESRRGRQLRHGDLVQLDLAENSITLRVAHAT